MDKMWYMFQKEGAGFTDEQWGLIGNTFLVSP